MRTAITRHLGVAACALLAGALFVGLALSRESMDLGMRRLGVQATTGRILEAAPPGQLVRCDFQGLERVEVRLTKRCPPDVEPAPILLEVRRVPEGADLEDVLAGAPERVAPMGAEVTHADGAYRRFRFDPIADSAGATFHLRLVPADGEPRTHWAPFFAMEATRGEGTPAGGIMEARPIALEFRPFHAHLSHIGVAFELLRPADGEVALDLFALPDSKVDPPEDFEPRRIGRGRLGSDAPVAAGWAIFELDLDEDLRYVPMRAVLTVPDGTRAVGVDGVPATRLFHSREAGPDDGLIGMTLGTKAFADRDLCVRLHGRGGVGANLTRLREHGGLWRAVLGLLLWTLTATAAVAAIRPPRPSA